MNILTKKFINSNESNHKDILKNIYMKILQKTNGLNLQLNLQKKKKIITTIF